MISANTTYNNIVEVFDESQRSKHLLLRVTESGSQIITIIQFEGSFLAYNKSKCSELNKQGL